MWNEKLKRLHENEKKRTITISIAAGTYSNGKSFLGEIPKIMDAQGRTAFQLQDEIKSISISRELAYLLGFVNHPKHALLSSHQRPPNSGIFYYFLYCDLIECQSNYPFCRKHHFEC